jgi:glycosyltransferase involved in cell wall biosynthesis
VFMGRLVDWKAVDITLDALSRARAQGIAATLDILGDGPERARLEARAAAPDLAGAVRFHGLLPQASCRDIVSGMDALIINSVYECGGAVVLEAMSLGLPIIASDWGGPADYVDDSCGILVHPVPRAGFADRLATAIGRLARDPALRARMGHAGEAKVRAEYDWEKKVDRILEIYQRASAAAISPVR